MPRTMETFYALVDAIPGREAEVREGLARLEPVQGFAPCREKSHDFLIRFIAPQATEVDDFLQTYVHRIPGVKGVEIVTDWSDYGLAVTEARRKLA